MGLHGVEKRRYDRDQKADERRKHEEERMASAAACGVNDNDYSSSSSGNSCTEDEQDPVYESYAMKTPKAKKPVNIVTSDVTSSLDRTRVSDRNATLILASVAKALGHDPSQYAVNKESV